MTDLLHLESEVNSAMRLDATVPLRPIGRSNGVLNASGAGNYFSKTPNKDKNASMNGSGSCRKKTPGSAARKRTPGFRGSRTPSSGDRFIPNRSTTQFELAHYKLCTQTIKTEEELAKMSPSQKEYSRIMNENLNGNALESNILSFREKPPKAPEGFAHNMRVLYSSGKTFNSSKKTTRYIPQVPERILDAPEIMDDFYLRLIDWSKHNLLAVALGKSMYAWDAGTGHITSLFELEGDDYVSCVNWTADGNHLALGLSNGTIELWDINHKKKLRTMGGHATRVGALSWNSYILSSGSRSGSIHHHDVREANHHVATLQGHTQEVCGLQWSPSGSYLASGGNDNLVNIWRAGAGSLLSDTRPVHTFNQHQAAVKALAWCPFQRNLLATGGGTADRHIRTWNCNNGASLQSIDAESQVCALVWSEEHKELLSGHGFSKHQLVLWKYPTMNKVTELTGHTARILHMCLSPDEQTVVSAGADETLRLWKCFQVDEKTKKSKAIAAKKQDTSCLKFQMR